MYSHLVLAAWSALLVSAGVVPKGVEVKTGFVSIFDAQSPPPAPKWNCEVRAWTRAPDLSPNAAVPAEARLALNGSACTDIIGWKAGLRFKERAIVKLKRNDTGHFPVEPKRQKANSTSPPRNDWNDILTPNVVMHFSGSSDDYQSQRKAYQEALQKEDLWNIHGAEKSVFDTQLALQLPSDLSVPQDLVQAFTVHVPNTNFPPAEDHAYMRSQDGRDSQMMNAEQLFEFFHTLELKNGTTLDVPSGLVGFLPSAQPTVAQLNELDSVNEDPKRVVLKAPEPPQVCEGDYPVRHIPIRLPEGCDNTTISNFQVEVMPKSDFVQGKNVTLDIVLTRSGNGSEYPAFMDVRLSVNKTLSWAHQFFAPLSEAEVFERPCRSWPRFPQQYEMRTVRPIEELERRRDEQAAREGQVITYSDGRSRLGKYGARHEFGDAANASQDEYRFQLEISIPRQVYPAFQTTFEDITNSLSFELFTSLGCAEKADKQRTAEKDKAELSRDDEWKAYSLPPLKKDTKRRGSHIGPMGRQKSHKGDLTIRVTPPPGPASGKIVHYMDDGALAPVLSGHHVQHDAFPLVNQQIRSETKEEKRKSRFIRSTNFRDLCGPDQPAPGSETRRCFNRNHGGRAIHAAKMWQAKEELAKAAASGQGDHGSAFASSGQVHFESGRGGMGEIHVFDAIDI